MKKWIDKLSELLIYAVLILALAFGWRLLGPSEEEKTERQIEKAMYEKEIYDEGYNQAKWKYEAELERANFEIDYAYEVGFERGYEDGYQQCLEDHGIAESTGPENDHPPLRLSPD